MFEFLDRFDRIDNEDMTLRIIEKKEAGRVQLPYYYYEILVDNVPVGKIRIRIGDNFHTYYNGHIGYEVDEGARLCPPGLRAGAGRGPVPRDEPALYHLRGGQRPLLAYH